MKKQILVLEELGIERNEFVKLANALEFEFIWNKTDIEISKLEGIVTVKTKIDSELLNRFPNLKFVAVAFTGYDCVDIDLCNKKNISVFNVPDYSSNSVAELVIAQAISLLREIPKAHNTLISGNWELGTGKELFGKTVGILGTGKIGLTTALYFKTLGCNIIAWSKTKKTELERIGTYIDDKKDFFSKADIITIHLPLNNKTNGIIGKNELKAMKKTAYLINSARGPIVNEEALIEVLQNKEIAGAALDVYTNEPIKLKNPLLKLENVILTPHIAYKTEEALIRRAQITIDNIIAFENNKEQNKVN